MVTSLRVSIEEEVDALARSRQRARPLVEQAATLVRELVGALGRPGRLRVPLGRDEPVLLERAQDPVEVAHVDAALAGQRRQRLEQLVAVRRSLAQEEEDGRLGEPLDPGANAPVAGADFPAAPCAAPSARPHSSPTCKTHMQMTVAVAADPAWATVERVRQLVRHTEKRTCA